MKSYYKLLPVIILVLPGCSRESPLVTNGEGLVLPYSTIVASGGRDGYYLNAELELYKDNMIHGLKLHLRIEIATQPKILEGTWTLGRQSGNVTADWLNFFGGQGGSPIIDGRLRLNTAGFPVSTQYIVNLPKTEINRVGDGF